MSASSARISVAEDGSTQSVLEFPGAGTELLFSCGTGKDDKSIWFQAGVRNTGTTPMRLSKVSPLDGAFTLDGSSRDWLLTGLHPVTSVIKPADSILPGETIHEYGSLYRPDGKGFVFGPAGDPVTWLGFVWRPLGKGGLGMDVSSPMDNVRVDPGEVRWGQRVMLVCDKPQAALARWADGIAVSHGARLTKPALSGWNNWNYLEQKDIARELVELTEAAKNSAGCLRPGLIQMDYNFSDPSLTQTLNAPWLPANARRVAETGARFGIRLGCGSRNDRPEIPTFDELITVIRSAVAHGFTYLKIYYPPGNARPGEKSTTFEVYRRQLAEIRRAAGDNTYLLFCEYAPNRATVGYFDSSRVGPNAHRESLLQAIPAALRAYPLHDRWFRMDSDSYFIGTDIANISQVDGSWPLVRTWLSMTGLSCGAAITSDPLYWADFKPYWHNVEVLTPPAREHTEVMDIGTGAEWPRLVGHVRRDWADATVALLWNPGVTERTITLDFKKAGLDPKRRYAVWSFWDDRYLGVVQGSWTTPRLAPSASQHLVFTDLDRSPDQPVFIGSNLHIYCGAAEIKRVVTGRSALSFELTDAGARNGDLFLYSRLQPILKTTVGCTVSGITSAGENVWRISLNDRKPGASQCIDMEILLPVTRQPWFWALIATVALSLLFAAWRYVDGLRLQRARALDQERARIARDIHDDLGASLTHIALLGELAHSSAHSAERTRTHADDIFRAASKLTRSVDEIVWALNPANDTLARFAGYVGDFAQDFLQTAGIACRFGFPDVWPERTLPPKTRHDLYLVIKETLHNIVSHSAARNVRLEISLRAERIRVLISDDGCGFDPQSTVHGRPGGGHGLANMRQRMHDIGGTLAIHSAPDTGTTVIMEVKL